MWSLDTIKDMNAEAGRAARGKEPHVPESEEEIEGYPPFPFPNLGDYEPPGWKEVEEHPEGEGAIMVDHSGFGTPGERADTPEQFRARLLRLYRADPTLGYGIVEVGQFQLFVGVFKRAARPRKGGA